MLTTLRMLLLCGLIWTATAPAFGAIIVYTDQAAWQAAVGGGTIVENFNSQTIRNFSSPFNESGFNGFSLSGNSGGDIVGIQSGGASGNINGTSFLRWSSWDGNAGPVINFNFDNPTNAFAFNWVDTDPTDEYELFVDGQSFFNPPFSSGTGSGFFGIIKTDGTFNTATIRNAVGQSPGGYIDPFGIDNVQMAATVTPEPASLAIWGLASLGLAYGARRARQPRRTK